MDYSNSRRTCPTKILIKLAINAMLIINTAFGADMLEVVQASEILSDIETGIPVNVTKAIVIGDLSISELNLSNVSSELGIGWNISFDEEMLLISTPIRIVDSEILGSVDLSNIFFSNSTEFSGTVFKNEAVFDGSIFARLAQFKGAQFFGNAGFSSNKFLEGTDFGESQFNDVDFNGVQFCNYAYFKDVQIDGIAMFSGAQFFGDAYFSNTQFNRECYFGSARFYKDAYFKEARFSYVDFGKSQFGGYVGFFDAKFDSDSYFRDARFRGISDFSNSEFIGDAFFEEVKFDKTFDLSKSKFDRLFISWDSIEEALVYEGSIYLSLVKNFEYLERFNDADRCYYQYRRISQDNKDLGWSKLEDVLAWLSCGYGVRPGYTLAWSFLFILSFGIVFWAGKGLQIDSDYYAHLRKNSPYGADHNYNKKIDNIPKSASSVSLLDSIYFSAIIFFHTHHPTSWEPSKRWSLWLLLLEDIVGWLLLALFLVALANVIIR